MAGPETFDVAIIGGGVVGCALERRFTLAGARVVLLERTLEVLDSASKANSAILHTGFDAATGSLEASCIAAGYAEYLEIHPKLNLPLLRSGALVLAWDDEQTAALPGLMDQACANGVSDVQALTAAELLRLEPGLSPKVRAGFRVPRECLIDPWSAPLAYLLQALENGATLRRGCDVTAGRFDGAIWHLATATGPVPARLAINTAGNFGDIVDDRLIGRSGRASFCAAPSHSPRCIPAGGCI